MTADCLSSDQTLFWNVSNSWWLNIKEIERSQVLPLERKAHFCTHVSFQGEALVSSRVSQTFGLIFHILNLSSILSEELSLNIGILHRPMTRTFP